MTSEKIHAIVMTEEVAVTVSAPDFLSYWQKVPQNIRDFYNSHRTESLTEVFAAAVSRINGMRLPAVSPKYMEFSLDASLAAELWKEVPESEKDLILNGERLKEKGANGEVFKYGVSIEYRMFDQVLGLMRNKVS